MLKDILFAEPTQEALLKAAIFCGAASLLLLVALAGLWYWGKRAGEEPDTARRIARNSLIPLALQIVTKALDLGFAAFVYYPLLSKSSAGHYDLASVLVVLYLGTIADFGLTIITTRDLARDPDRAPSYFRAMVRLRTALGLVLVPIALAVPTMYALLYALGLSKEPVGAEQFIVAGVLTLTLIPTGYSAAVTALLHARERMQLPAALGLITNIISTLLRGGALFLGLGIVGVALGALLATMITSAMFALALRSSLGKISLRGPGLAWRPLLSQGWPLMLNSLLLFVFFRFDAFIIQAFQNSQAVADYGAAYRYINLTQIIPPIVVNAIFPLLSRRAAGDQQGFRHAYYYTVRLLLLLALPLATGISLLATPLISLLAGEEFLPGGAVALALLIWYLPLAYVNGLTQYVLIAQDQARVITRAFGWTALFNLLTNLVLIPLWGIYGAAVTTVASELVLYLIYRRTLARGVGAPPLVALLWRPALASLTAALIFLGLEGLSLPLALLAAVPGYVGALAALRTLTVEDRRVARRILGKADISTAP